MNGYRKALAVFIVISLLSLQQTVTFAQQSSKQNKVLITKHQPAILTSPEIDIPKNIGKKKINKWVYVGAGALALGALGAMSNQSDDKDPPAPSTTGGFEVSW